MQSAEKAGTSSPDITAWLMTGPDRSFARGPFRFSDGTLEAARASYPPGGVAWFDELLADSRGLPVRPHQPRTACPVSAIAARKRTGSGVEYVISRG